MAKYFDFLVVEQENDLGAGRIIFLKLFIVARDNEMKYLNCYVKNKDYFKTDEDTKNHLQPMIYIYSGNIFG